MKIGLYTLHASNNVGAMLQAFALTKVLEKNGAQVEIVNVYDKITESQNHHRARVGLLHDVMRLAFRFLHPDITKGEKNFDGFHSYLPLSKRYFSAIDYINTPEKYDIHLIGSDQVWNLQKGYDYARLYFLDYLPDDAVRMSYASSFGTTKLINDADRVKKALNKFKCISVREDTAVDYLHDLINKHCEQVVDPTLLLTKEEWDNYIAPKPIIGGNYIFYYGMNRDENTWNMLCEAKKMLHAKIVGFPGSLPPQYHFDKYIYASGPLEFVNLIKHAKLVITSSFHGLAFAVNYEKPFVLLNFGERMERMDSLIRLLDAGTHKAQSINDIGNILKLNNVETMSAKLNDARSFSLKWIKNNITHED